MSAGINFEFKIKEKIHYKDSKVETEVGVTLRRLVHNYFMLILPNHTLRKGSQTRGPPD